MPREADFNMGAAGKIKLKIWQEFGLLDFDLTQVKGWSLEVAYLHLKPTGGHRLGLNAGTDLNWLTLSSVSHPWVEGRSKRYGPDTEGFGATFNESSYQNESWGWQGSRIWNMILGNGNSMRKEGQLEALEDGWFRIEVPSDLMSAMVTGASHGLAILDGSTETISNSTVASRETDEGPFLLVKVGASDPIPPSPPDRLELHGASDFSTSTNGALRLGFQVPDGAFSYNLRIDGEPVPRWQIPFADSPGAWQSFTLVDLPPAVEVEIEVMVLDASGNSSQPVAAKGTTSPAWSAHPLPSSPFQPHPADPPLLGKARVWALPELTEVDPVSGRLLFATSASDPRGQNAVWDGASRTVRLAAAKGEIVSFQIVIEGRVTGCRLETTSLRGPAEIQPEGFRLWRTWYVGRQSEYALPMDGDFDVPTGDNAIEGQTLQAVTLDLPIPIEIPAGSYAGTVEVSCNEGGVQLSLNVLVYDVTIPTETHFLVELNCYKGPGTAGSFRFIDSFRLAHYHRATINRVPYSHRGRVNPDWAPEVDTRGRIIDWAQFDANLGGLFDGSWFVDNPRSGVPAPILYMPLFEGWPLDFKRHYRPGRGVPTTADDRYRRLRHDILAPPIEQAFSAEFQRTFVEAVRDFRNHFRQRGWNRTILQFYLNNKPKYGYTLWTLDEPSKYLDWAALNFFGNLFKRGIDDPEVYALDWQEELYRVGLAGLMRDRPTMLFRADVSRPMWQGSLSDGVINWVYVSSIAYRIPRIIRELKVRAPALLSQYGSPSAVEDNNWDAAVWPLATFVRHFDGILPWQSLGGPAALRQPMQHALLIDGGSYGHAVASYRLHGFRYGAQICELLRLVQLKTGWSREQLGLLVAQAVPLQFHPDESIDWQRRGPPFARPTGAWQFLQLKEGLLQLLTQDFE